MSFVVGCDLSSQQIDLVKIDETTNDATWRCITLTGGNAWERTLQLPNGIVDHPSIYWDDVFLVAIEAPYGRGHAGATSVLNRIVGAVAASLPRQLRRPECCWIVRPDEWKRGLGLKTKPTEQDIAPLVDRVGWWPNDQNARDAAALARWARDENARGIQQALTA